MTLEAKAIAYHWLHQSAYVIEEDFFTAAQPGQEIAAGENLVAPHKGALLRKMETTGARHRRRATT